LSKRPQVKASSDIIANEWTTLDPHSSQNQRENRQVGHAAQQKAQQLMPSVEL
jgi:hypothetical protein